jgi:hypothetical protein
MLISPLEGTRVGEPRWLPVFTTTFYDTTQLNQACNIFFFPDLVFYPTSLHELRAVVLDNHNN